MNWFFVEVDFGQARDNRVIAVIEEVEFKASSILPAATRPPA
jgi:hypothetical protein